MLDDGLMSSMREEVLGEKTEVSNHGEIEEATEKGSESSESNEETSTKYNHEEYYDSVYWTKNGGVYHLYRDCSYIKSSSDLISGTVEEAVEAGKSGTCSRCQSRKDNE